MAFFPCVRFENQIMIHFRGQACQMKNWTWQEKMRNNIELQHELTNNYEFVNMLFMICLDRGLKFIMENPFSEEHYLRRYWCYPPSIIDTDRRERGDYYKKPTQYWFVNCEPKNNFIFEAQNWNALDYDKKRYSIKKEEYKVSGADSLKTARSMIHPDYANRFIREYIL